MTVASLGDWTSTYEPGLKDYYATYQTNPAYLVINFWKQWIDGNVDGIESADPYPGSTGVTSASALSPLPLEVATSSVVVAAMLTTAWTNYMAGITWPLIPPPGTSPFSAILAIQTSPTGLAAAAGILTAGLVAELALLPPNPLTAFADKAASFANLFRTATIAAGIQISGLDKTTPTPVPLVIPLSPVK